MQEKYIALIKPQKGPSQAIRDMAHKSGLFTPVELQNSSVDGRKDQFVKLSTEKVQIVEGKYYPWSIDMICI